MANVAFIGLGVMGFPMAGHLPAKGHDGDGLQPDRQPRPRSGARSFGGGAPRRPREAAAAADIVFTCVGNDDDLRSVAWGRRRPGRARAGAIFVDHTTASADVARELSRHAGEQGAHFIDAPVSGGQAGAENGALTIMCGGEADGFAGREPVLRRLCAGGDADGPGRGRASSPRWSTRSASPGSCRRWRRASTSRQRAGLDPDQVLATISKGAAQSWQMENRWRTMADGKFDFGFAVDWMRKDLAIGARRGRGATVRALPVTALVDQFYA